MDPARLSLAGGIGLRVIKFLKLDLDDALELAFFGSWQMIEIATHMR